MHEYFTIVRKYNRMNTISLLFFSLSPSYETTIAIIVSENRKEFALFWKKRRKRKKKEKEKKRKKRKKKRARKIIKIQHFYLSLFHSHTLTLFIIQSPLTLHF